MKKTLVRYALTMALALIPILSEAQGLTIRGRVLDQDSKPLPGATVSIKGAGSGAVADMSGNYSLTASEGDVLVAQYIGYMDSELTVDKKDVIDFVLSEDNTFL